MKGRKPLPLEVHEMNGNPSKLNLPDNPPEFEVIDADVPDEILENEYAREEWNRTVPHFIEAQIFRTIDRRALIMFCITAATWRFAQEQIKKLGSLIRTPSGYMMQNPYFPIANKAFDQMKWFMSEFGMTPSSRTRIAMSLDIPINAEVSELEKELFGDE